MLPRERELIKERRQLHSHIKSSGKIRHSGNRSEKTGAKAMGALAVGAVAIGALAIGVLAIGRLVVGRARIRRIEVDDLVVRRLHIIEKIQTPEKSEAGR